MSTINEQESIIEVQTIVLENINFARGFDPAKVEDIQASLGMHLEPPKEGQFFRSTRCNVELKDSEENEIVLVQTIFRTEFDIQGNSAAPGIDAYLSSLAMRVTYPYHRQLISTLTAQSGLPGMTIPLISDDQLDVISKDRGTKESATVVDS